MYVWETAADRERRERNDRIQARVNATKYTTPATYTEGNYYVVISQAPMGHVNNDIIHMTFYSNAGVEVDYMYCDSSLWSIEIVELAKKRLARLNESEISL